jgi:hypothetical protein
VPVAAALLAFRHRDALAEALGLVGQARASWLAAAALMIGGVYLARAAVYRVPLRLLGYPAPLPALWAIALAASALHQLLPAAGAGGGAFLAYALSRRGVAAGQAPLIALVDALSYDAAMATLVAASLAWLAATGLLPAGVAGGLVVPGLGVVAAIAGLWWFQRDQTRLALAVLRLKDGVARRLGRRWPDEPIHRFLGQFFEGKAVIGRHPRSFLRMVGLQYITVGCDVAALYLAFVALGRRPSPDVVFMGLVAAMAGVLAIAAPGGGGGFEVILTAFFAMRGVPPGEAVAATLLYRAVAFWLPIAVSLPAVVALRRRAGDARDRPPSPA